MARKRRKPQAKPRAKRVPKPIRIREHALRPMIREACRTGLVEAIEHTSNFWDVSDGYKKYIEQQIALQSEALMAAVRTVISEELSPFRRQIARARRRKR